MADEQVGSPIGLSKEQKIGFVLLLVFAVLTVILGVLKIRNTLYAPFALNNKVPASFKDEVNGVDALKFRDTDHDGLSDFDELYVYETSPYLYDTFNYNLSDKEVVERGLPLCPGAGKNCTGAAAAGGTVLTTSTPNAVYVGAANPGTPPPNLKEVLQDPAQVRELLVQAGMNRDALKKISDSDLMKLVSQLLVSQTSTLKQ